MHFEFHLNFSAQAHTKYPFIWIRKVFFYIKTYWFFFSILFFFVWAAVLFSERNTSERKTFAYTILIIWNDHIDFFGFLTIWVWLVRSVYFQLKNWNFWAWLKNKIIQIHQAKLCSPFSKHKIVKQNPMSAMYSKGLNCIPGSLYFEESNAFNLLLLTWPYKLWNISAGSKTH